jgi:surface antigen
VLRKDRLRLVYSAFKACRPLGVIVAALSVAGCAVSMPLGPMFSSADTTGSITPRDGRFTTAMSDSDWAKAKEALTAATVASEGGRATPWENRETGLKGTVTPVATAYAAQDRTCRSFVATLVDSEATAWYQGEACRDAAGVSVSGVKPWAPPSSQ